MDTRDPRPADGQLSQWEETAQELFAEYLAARACGESRDFDAFAAEHPAHAERLLEIHAGWDDFEAQLAEAAGRAKAVEFRRELVAGTVIGDFRLTAVLAEGGMGQVWEARQVSLDRAVALKVMKPERATERGRLFFEREARAGGRLSHEGIVSALAAGEDDGVHWIAMELVEGGRTLRNLIEEYRALKELPPDHYESVALLFARICDAVQAAHDCQVIHRDLKPSNVLLTPEGLPKITDFGLARIVDELSLSRTGEFAGTYFYMSPEQVTARRIGIDHRTDVFSLGVVLYEVLTLERPFEGETGHEVAERILYDEPRDPRRIGTEVPAPLVWICAKAIEKRRADRYDSMRDLCEDLQRYLAEARPRARPPGPIRRLRRWSRRRPVAATALGLGSALLVVSLVLGLVLFAGRGRRARAHWSSLQERAALAITAGDLAGARVMVDEALAIFPDEADPHLLMASGLVSFGRMRDAASEIRAADLLGIDVEPPDSDDGALWTRRALLALVGEEALNMSEVERDLERALALDPDQAGAWFLLYQTKLVSGDFASAGVALRTLRRWSREGAAPELHRLLDALELEADGDPAAAIASIETLTAEAGIDPERLARLHPHRVLGRAYLVLARGMEGNVDQLNSAQEALERALEADPRDISSRINLAIVQLQFWSGTSWQPHRLAEAAGLLDEVRRSVEISLESSPNSIPALELACQLSVLHLEQLSEQEQLDPPPGAVWEEVEGGIERLRELDVENPQVERCSAWLAYWRASALVTAEDWDAVHTQLEACLALERDHFWALSLATQAAYWRGEFTAGIKASERGVALWRSFDGNQRRRWMGRFHAELQLWRIWNAEQAGLFDLIPDSRAAFESELESGTLIEWEMMLGYVEHLALTSDAQLEDCERAQQLFEEHELASHATDPNAPPGAAEIAAAIRAGCGF